jgi:hypothetical protein
MGFLARITGFCTVEMLLHVELLQIVEEDEIDVMVVDEDETGTLLLSSFFFVNKGNKDNRWRFFVIFLCEIVVAFRLDSQ